MSGLHSLYVFQVVIMSELPSAKEETSEIIAEFSFFDDWADRYQHLIDQGRRLPQIKPEWRDEAHILKRLPVCGLLWFGSG